MNVDGLNYIEEQFKITGKIVGKRKNMHIGSTNCTIEKAGVDLNRNYGYMFGKGRGTSS